MSVVLDSSVTLAWIYSDELTAATDAVVQRFASGPTRAYGRIKKLLRGSLGHTLEQQFDLERAAFKESTLTADFKEGTAAFVGKRKPKFTGK